MQLRTTSTAPTAALAHVASFPPFRSPAFLKASAQIERLARHPWIPVLLEGEAGTGKTTFARRLHELSPRASGKFCHVLLSAVDDSLASSDLFGHVTGAFTDARASRHGQFASANGGTLFLDEIGKASRAVQQKLLHAVEYREIRPIGSDRSIHVDARIVAATNQSLRKLTDEGAFLPDLNARFEMYRVVLPPLRDRRADISTLVHMAVHRHATDCGYASPPAMDTDLMESLNEAPWPNNLRELDATIHRLLIDAEGAPVLDLSHCQDTLAYLCDSVRPPLTRELVESTIAREGSISAAARVLRWDRTTIHRHRREWRNDVL